MKKLLLLAALLISVASFAQLSALTKPGAFYYVDTSGVFHPDMTTLRFRLDTTVLFEGQKPPKHIHDADLRQGKTRFCSKCINEQLHTWVQKQNNEPEVKAACKLCFHDAAGCPDTWAKYYVICTKCLRHLYIQETRTVEKAVDPYDEAMERLSKIGYLK